MWWHEGSTIPGYSLKLKDQSSKDQRPVMRGEWLGKLAEAGPGGFCALYGKTFYVSCDGEVAVVLINGTILVTRNLRSRYREAWLLLRTLWLRSRNLLCVFLCPSPLLCVSTTFLVRVQPNGIRIYPSGLINLPISLKTLLSNVVTFWSIAD